MCYDVDIMGEMSDWLNEQMESDCALYYDNLMYDEETDTYWPIHPRKIPVCKFCDKTPLLWKKVNEHWYLHELSGEIHNCPKNPLPLDILKNLYKKKKKMNEQLLPIPSWDESFMHDVYWWARRSKDPRTKIGAVLVHWESKDPISHAYNGFARKVNDDVPVRWERPEKYFWISHAESNSILNCARTGRSTVETIMFTQGVPCADCANDIIQAGITEVVVHKQWQEYEKSFRWEKWNDSAKRSDEKFKEANIKIRVFDKILGLEGVLDGKVIQV